MNQTSGDSKYDIVFVSFGKEQEQGIEVKAEGEKDNIFKENMVISAGDAEMLKNGTLRTKTGAILGRNANYAQVKENNQKRITSFAIEKAKREGKIKDFKQEKARREEQESQELA